MKTLRLLSLGVALGASFLPLQCAGQARFRTIYRFGSYPDAQTPTGLANGPNGVLYGASATGGIYGYGAVFSLTPPAAPGESWTETVLYSFAPQNGGGAYPAASPVVGADGTIYGTTLSPGYGTVWMLQPPSSAGDSWTETVLYRATYGGGIQYLSGAIPGPNGAVYALAETGSYGRGAVFELTPPTVPGGEWGETVIYDFTGGADGSGPAGMIVDPKGVLYGTTTGGGSSGAGTVFELKPPATSWTEEVIYNFTTGDDGCEPTEPPVMDADGNLYGTTGGCGSADLGTVWELQPPSAPGGIWTQTVLYAFQNSGDGKLPASPLIVRNGIIYGALATGVGTNGKGGSVFELQKPASPGQPWTETILYLFTSSDEPYGNLALDGIGKLVGATNQGDPLPGYPLPPYGIGRLYCITGMGGGAQ